MDLDMHTIEFLSSCHCCLFAKHIDVYSWVQLCTGSGKEKTKRCKSRWAWFEEASSFCQDPFVAHRETFDLDRRMGAHELETCSLPYVNFFLAHSLVKWNAHWSWIYGCKEQDLLNILLLLCETHWCLLMDAALHRTDQILDVQQPKPSSPHRTVLFFGCCKIHRWALQRLAVFAGALVWSANGCGLLFLLIEWQDGEGRARRRERGGGEHDKKALRTRGD